MQIYKQIKLTNDDYYGYIILSELLSDIDEVEKWVNANIECTLIGWTRYDGEDFGLRFGFQYSLRFSFKEAADAAHFELRWL